MNSLAANVLDTSSALPEPDLNAETFKELVQQNPKNHSEPMNP